MSRLSLILVLSFVFVAVLLFIQGIYWAIRIRRVERDKDLSRRIGVVAAESEDQSKLLMQDSRDAFARQLGGAGAWLQSVNLQAGRTTTVRSLLMRSMLLAGLGMGVLFPLLRSGLAVSGIVLGFIPLVLLARQAEKRSLLISEQLPDALDLIARSLQAGYGLSEALRVVAMESPVPLAQEFGRVYEEHNLGREFRACIENLMRRNPRNFDLRIFSASVLLQRETGGNLIEVVANIAHTIRSRFTLKAKIRALTSEARLSSYILGSLPFAVSMLIMVVRPTYLLPLVQDPMGHMLLGYAFTSYAVGILVMKALSEVET